MKKSLILSLVALFCFGAVAFAQPNGPQPNGPRPQKQPGDGYQFTTVKAMPITSIKNQGSSGTCWAFSTTSFFESEAIKKGTADTTLNLSVMYSVYWNYVEKFKKYVRVDGYLCLAEGGSFEDVSHALEDYGAVQEKDMPTLLPGEKRVNFKELTATSKGFAEAFVKNARGPISPRYMTAYQEILQTYLGAVPSKTTYKGVEYSPKDFVTKGLKLDMNDYVSITSFTHHPFYTQFAIEVPDNWRWDLSYNVPLNELMAVIDNALENGYTVAWGADVSETGFTRTGLAVVPDVEANEKAMGSDQERWLGKDPNEKRNAVNNLYAPGKELVITQELRQQGYDNKTTTDDHGMHMFGIAKDQNGTKYYMIKNSWGKTGKYDGIWYISKAFVEYKTMNILVNKNAVPKDIRKKLGF